MGGGDRRACKLFKGHDHSLLCTRSRANSRQGRWGDLRGPDVVGDYHYFFFFLLDAARPDGAALGFSPSTVSTRSRLKFAPLVGSFFFFFLLFFFGSISFLFFLFPFFFGSPGEQFVKLAAFRAAGPGVGGAHVLDGRPTREKELSARASQTRRGQFARLWLLGL